MLFKVTMYSSFVYMVLRTCFLYMLPKYRF